MPAPPLTPERWRITEEILLAAWTVPPEDREELLLARCGGDETLLAEVRSLIAAQAEADGWVAPGCPAPSSVPTGRQRVGPFALERLIGRGGMGAVYLAHRADGQFEQKVAVKLVGLPFEIEPFRERFRKERQILAGLNHPNITRLLDGGVSDENELYLVMEFVDGVSFDRYCAEGRAMNERLTLFRKVCDAVQYAHRNLIVHRDIKPSNILVTAEGTPKLLDFGTAKLIAEEDVTQTGLGLMTAGYASPEQLRGGAVTTPSNSPTTSAVISQVNPCSRIHRLLDIARTSFFASTQQQRYSWRYLSRGWQAQPCSRFRRRVRLRSKQHEHGTSATFCETCLALPTLAGTTR